MRSRTTRNRNRRRHRQGWRQETVALPINRLHALPDELQEVIQSYVRFTPASLKAVLALYEHDKKVCIHRHGDVQTWDVSRLYFEHVPPAYLYSELQIPAYTCANRQSTQDRHRSRVLSYPGG